MKNLGTAQLVALLQALQRIMLGAYPAEFYDGFGEEMRGTFAERLAEAGRQGTWAVLVVGGRELGDMPLSLVRLHLYQWHGKQQRARQIVARVPGQALFGVAPADNDGRFSRQRLLLEVTPFLFTTGLILLLTYSPPAWLPSRWRDPLDTAGIWAGLLPLLVLLPGLAHGMPRWAYPFAGLVVGYGFWAFVEQQLTWLWGLLMVAVVLLGILAVVVDQDQPLPPFFKRLGASAALDWTRLSFGVFGAVPLIALAAFDNARLNQQNAYLALALLLMPLTALAYGRCRRQAGQLAALFVGATLIFVPALLESTSWQGGWGGVGWLATLWAGVVAFLLLPLISVPMHWASLNLSTRGNRKE